MRTTIRIDDDLFHELKRLARAKDLSLSELVNLTIRQGLAREEQPRRPVFRQKTRDLGRALFDATRANAAAAISEDEAILGKLASFPTE